MKETLKIDTDINENWSVFEKEAIPHLSAIRKAAVYFCNNPADVEDIVQETLFAAMKSFNKYKVGTNCRAWLIQIARNVSYSNYRKTYRQIPVGDGNEFIFEKRTFESDPLAKLLAEESLEVLDTLPTKYRTAVFLSDVKEYKYVEIAEELDIPIGTVMSRIHRGRHIARKQLEKKVFASL